MAEQGTVLVTGATGGVGGQVVRQLVEAGVPVRALARKPEAADLPAPVTVVRGDLSDADSLDTALDGVDSVFLLFPTLQADAAAPDVVTKIAGYARRVVYLSTSMADSEQAEKDSGGILGSHRNLERLIRSSGLEWTFLRPGGFAKNTLMWTEQLRTGDVLRWFHGGASRSLIHEADIAAVAVRVLTEEGHNGAAYHLTGPARLTQVEQLAAIGEAIGRSLRFEELSPEVAIRELFAGVPTSLVRPIVDGHAEMVHHPEEVTDVVRQLTGRPARSFAQWAADHADDFR